MRWRGPLSILLLALALPLAATAAEFRSVADAAAILYDAPSAKAKKVYILNRGYPVELVVSVEGWAKVRDANGDLSWIEAKKLSDKRTVMVKVPLAQVHESASETAAAVFQAQQNVILEVVEPPAGAWLRIRHQDGQSGFIKTAQVWGA